MPLQGMDTYSNILYVKEQFAALSHLAHRVSAADKYQPETCCIIGNYYSLKGQHEKVSNFSQPHAGEQSDTLSPYRLFPLRTLFKSSDFFRWALSFSRGACP